MKANINITNKDRLFNPNYIYVGDPTPFLIDKPGRSKNLERYVDEKSIKILNKKFIKDGYMYLLRGAKNGQESGFYSQLYRERKNH